MGTNILAGNGLVVSRNITGASPTYQANGYTIKKGYGSNLGLGDLVKTGTGSNQGYVILATNANSAELGVFAGVLPYYDTNLQQTFYGQNGAYVSTASPSADINCLVIDDPFAVFRVQMSGGPWTQSMRGQNIGFLAGTNGAQNISGISTLVVDAATIASDNTLPFRIVGVVGFSGGPQDPANTNPVIEVRLNTSEMLASAGI